MRHHLIFKAISLPIFCIQVMFPLQGLLISILHCRPALFPLLSFADKQDLPIKSPPYNHYSLRILKPLWTKSTRPDILWQHLTKFNHRKHSSPLSLPLSCSSTKLFTVMNRCLSVIISLLFVISMCFFLKISFPFRKHSIQW